MIANGSSISGYIASESTSVMPVKSTAWNIHGLDDLHDIYNHLLMAAATCLVTTKNGESGSEFPRTSPVSLQKWTPVRSTAWNILVLDYFNNIYNHLLMAAATCLVTTKNGESGSEFPRASPASLQRWTIKIPATQHLLPRKSRMQSY